MKLNLLAGFTGCTSYYPDEGETEATFPPFKVELLNIRDEEHFSERHLRISRRDSDEPSREIVHLQVP